MAIYFKLNKKYHAIIFKNELKRELSNTVKSYVRNYSQDSNFSKQISNVKNCFRKCF